MFWPLSESRDGAGTLGRPRQTAAPWGSRHTGSSCCRPESRGQAERPQGPGTTLPASSSSWGPVSLACGRVTSLPPPSAPHSVHLPLDQGRCSPGGSHLETTSAETRCAHRSLSRVWMRTWLSLSGATAHSHRWGLETGPGSRGGRLWQMGQENEMESSGLPARHCDLTLSLRRLCSRVHAAAEQSVLLADKGGPTLAAAR